MSHRPVSVKSLGRPKESASIETRERLLAVARQAFAQNGFEATTNRQIAAAAGITAGAIYHYYDSKAELYAAVFGEVQVMIYGAFEAAIAPHCALLDRFAAVLDKAVEMNRSDPSIAGFVVGVAGETQRHPEFVELLAPYRLANSNFLSKLAEEAAASGELAADIDPQALEDLLNAVLSGLARFGNLTGDSDRHARSVAAFKRILAGTLTTKHDQVTAR